MYLTLLNGILFIAVTYALLKKYRQSGQWGFLWLFIPLVLLPLLSLPIAYWTTSAVDKLSAGEPNVRFPFSLVESGQISLGELLSFWNAISHILWSAFVLVGLLMIIKPKQKDS